MNQRRHVTAVAAAATVLGSLPLSTVFYRWTWLFDVVIIVVAVAGVGLLVRGLRAPFWAPTLAMAAAYIALLSWIFHSGHEIGGLIPTWDTIRHWNDLLLSAGTDMRELGIPVDDRDGLLFLTTLGVGAVAILVDLFAVVLRRPALAGLPLLAIYSVPVAVHDDSVNFLPFVAGAAGYLWLLVTDNVDKVRRFGRRFTGDGRDVDLWEPSPLAATGRRLALIGVLLAVILPLAVPGMTGGVLARFGTGSGGTGPGGGTGSGPTVNMLAQLHGSLTRQGTFEMVRVTTNEAKPGYLRLGVADEVTPAGFSSRQPQGGLFATGTLPAATTVSGPEVTATPYRATVEIRNLRMQLLPIFMRPTKIEKLDTSWRYDTRRQVVFSNRSDSKGKRYTFDYVQLDFDPDALALAKDLPASDGNQQQLTSVPTVVEVQKIVAELTAGKIGPYAKVMALYDYFTKDNGFGYSLQTKPGTSGSDIVDFLENKQGYCEQYAAALAWMVRAAKIPARVAFGFTRGSSQKGQTFSLTNYNLHAWTEVYFDRFGWVPFDVTPAQFVPGSVRTDWAPDLDAPAGPNPGRDDEGNLKPGQVPSGDASGAATDPINERNLPNSTGGSGGSPASRWPIWTLAGLLAALALLAAPALARGMLRRRRWPTPPPGGTDVTVVGDTGPPGAEGALTAAEIVVRRERQRAHAAWDELVDTMTDFQIPIDEAHSPRGTAEHLVTVSRLGGDAAAGARLLGHAEERARYARQPLADADLAGSLQQVRQAVINRVSRRTRLIALLLPPSVLQRWRSDAAGWSIRALNTLGNRRNALLRALAPRAWMGWRPGR